LLSNPGRYLQANAAPISLINGDENAVLPVTACAALNKT
jgi:hypothetical protein